MDLIVKALAPIFMVALAICLGLKALAPPGLDKVPLWLVVLATGFCAAAAPKGSIR
jgi:hypothetical protein